MGERCIDAWGAQHLECLHQGSANVSCSSCQEHAWNICKHIHACIWAGLSLADIKENQDEILI